MGKEIDINFKSKTLMYHLKEKVKMCPNKNSFIDTNRAITYAELDNESKCIAQCIIDKKLDKIPVMLFIGKSVEFISAFLGVGRSGNFSINMDIDMPKDRIVKIIEKVEPKLIITDALHIDISKMLASTYGMELIIYDEAMKVSVDEKKINKIESEIKLSDILLIQCTSGSTGVPKAIVINHGSQDRLVSWNYVDVPFSFDTIFGDLIPMCYAVLQYYISATIIHGATTYLIPQKLIKEPAKLMQCLYDNKINTLIWVPTMLACVADLDCLDKPYLPDLKVVMFCGEAMPARLMNKWRSVYKNTQFISFCSLSECVDSDLYYYVEKDFPASEYVPITKKVDSGKVLLINKEGKEAVEGEEAEIYYRVYGETFGYYKDPIKTNECFVSNPIDKNDTYKYFKSGDLVRIKEDGDVVYFSRTDSQIKYMGNRINLGEIESVVLENDKIKRCMAVFNQEKKQIGLCYVGDMDEKDLISMLKKAIPNYMMPKKVVKIDSMPMNSSGKLDRVKIKSLFD